MSRRPERLGGRVAGLRLSLRLALRGIAYRRTTAVVVLGLAIVAATAAVVGPLYSRAAQESIARGALVRADQFSRAVHADVSTNGARNALGLESTLQELGGLTDPAFGKPVTSQLTSGRTTSRGGVWKDAEIEVPIVDRADLCDHLPIQSGRCPTEPGEVALTKRSADLLGMGLGDTFVEGLSDLVDDAGVQVQAHLTVVGLTPDTFDLQDEYWVGRGYFRYHPYQREYGRDSSDPPLTDTGFLAHGTGKALGFKAYTVDVPVDGHQIDLNTAQGVLDQVAAVSHSLGQGNVAVTTQLPALISSAHERSTVVRFAAPLAAFQLVLLAWVILAHVVSAATQERAPELGLAKLRGQSPGRTVRFGLAEVVVLLLVSAPIGTVLGWWAVRLVAEHVLEPGTPLRMTGWVVASVIIGVLGGIGAAAVAARGVARGHVADLLRRVPGASRVRGAGALEGAVLALVLAGVVQLLVAPDAAPGPVASAAPGIIALAGALVAARLLRVVSRRGTASALERGRPGPLFGWAGVARRAGTTRTTGVLAAAICLLLVGVQAWTVAEREREHRALAETGAAVVLDVRTGSARALVDAVRSADPGRGYAMAAMQLQHDNESNPAVAVDGERVDAVAGFAGRAPGAVQPVLRPDLVDPIMLRPGPVTASVSASNISSPSPLAVSVTVETPTTWAEVPLGDLRPGTRTMRGTVPAACADGCRLVALTVSHPALDIVTSTVDLTVRSLTGVTSGTTPTAIDGQFDRAGAWRPPVDDGSGKSAKLTPGPALKAQIATLVSFPTRIMHGDSPSPVPAVAGDEAPVRDGVVAVRGADTVPATVAAAGSAPFVPGLGRKAVMVDLELELRSVAQPESSGLQVWLSRDDAAAEKSLVQTLGKAGVEVTGRASAIEAKSLLDKEGAVLALLLFLACGAVALLVATGALLVAAMVGARQRAVEVASLRAVGVPNRTVRRGLLVENLAGVLVAVVTAVAAAALVTYVVLPVLPMADEDSVVITVDPSANLAALGWTVLVVVLWLTVLALVVAWRQLRSGTAERIREAGR